VAASDRYRPDGAGHEYGDIPPDCRNHRDPTTGATPIAIPASVGSMPVLTLSQNSRSLARGCDGAPGDRNGARPVTSLIQSDGLPTTPSDQVLLPPVEPSVYTSKAYVKLCKDLKVTQSMGGIGSSADNSLAESFNASLKRELLAGRSAFPDQATAYRAVFRWANRYNTRRRHSAIGNISPNAYEAAASATLAEAV